MRTQCAGIIFFFAMCKAACRRENEGKNWCIVGRIRKEKLNLKGTKDIWQVFFDLIKLFIEEKKTSPIS